MTKFTLRSLGKRVAASIVLGSSVLFAGPLLAAESQIHPVTGFLPDLKFDLQSVDNQHVTQDDLKGKIVLMFFGYANCPDICPTTMAQLSAVVENLGDAGDNVQVVFVSVDPHRDTPEILKAYVDAFDTNAIGLTGNEKTIADLARRYRVAFQIEKPTNADSDYYEVAHSRGVYIFDERGKARVLASDSESVEDLTEAVRKLL